MSYVSKYFYCCIQSEGLLYDAERELLAIAKLLVNEVTFYHSYISRTQIRIQNLLQKFPATEYSEMWPKGEIQYGCRCRLNLFPVINFLVTWFTWVGLLQLPVKFGVKEIIPTLVILLLNYFPILRSSATLVLCFWISDRPRNRLGGSVVLLGLFSNVISMELSGLQLNYACTWSELDIVIHLHFLIWVKYN